jgi:SAM-dependent methyltransferase
LLAHLAKQGERVGGIDLNPKAVEFCNARLAKIGTRDRAWVADMSDFETSDRYDVAFNTINSFRHLDSERAATAHLRCIADGLAAGGLYVLGIHLTPTEGERMETEAWVARRGNLQINSYMWSKELDLENRNERLGMTLDVYTPSSHQRIVDEMNYRTYTAGQFDALLRKVPQLEVAAVHDFCYEIDVPIEVRPTTEDVVYVLRKRRERGSI